jgi:hypothetical protein
VAHDAKHVPDVEHDEESTGDALWADVEVVVSALVAGVDDPRATTLIDVASVLLFVTWTEAA